VVEVAEGCRSSSRESLAAKAASRRPKLESLNGTKNPSASLNVGKMKKSVIV
jgi:hypothetical protein